MGREFTQLPIGYISALARAGFDFVVCPAIRIARARVPTRHVVIPTVEGAS